MARSQALRWSASPQPRWGASCPAPAVSQDLAIDVDQAVRPGDETCGIRRHEELRVDLVAHREVPVLVGDFVDRPEPRRRSVVLNHVDPLRLQRGAFDPRSRPTGQTIEDSALPKFRSDIGDSFRPMLPIAPEIVPARG